MIGRLLYRLRASAGRSPLASVAFAATDTIVLRSSGFADGTPMPQRYAGHGVGDNISPELRWTETPCTTRQLVLLLDDVDVPLPKPLIHNAAVLDPSLTALDEGAFVVGSAGVRIVPTLLSKTGYAGPRPIPGHGPHHYRFHLLALDCPVPETARNVKAVLAVAAGHVLARGALTGTYERL
jgi:phosphatidylethanolamine-binding protein (PEBP) family uncharacterized protein